MDPEELEFVGEAVLTSIVPNFSHDAIHLICGTFGPFRAGIPVNVPLWLGHHLRKQQKCRFVAPYWMNVETLEELKEEEKRNQSFCKMPSDHYMVETKLIIGETPEDVPQSEEIRTIIKDIFDARMSKYRAFMDTYVRGESTQIKLDNLTQFEIHSWTPIFTQALDLIGRIKEVGRSIIINCYSGFIKLPFPSRNRMLLRITVKQIDLVPIACEDPHRSDSTSPRIRVPCPVELLIISKPKINLKCLQLNKRVSFQWIFIFYYLGCDFLSSFLFEYLFIRTQEMLTHAGIC